MKFIHISLNTAHSGCKQSTFIHVIIHTFFRSLPAPTPTPQPPAHVSVPYVNKLWTQALYNFPFMLYDAPRAVRIEDNSLNLGSSTSHSRSFIRHCGLVESARTWDGRGCVFDSWHCRIYIISHVHRAIRLLGSLWGSLGKYGLIQKLCWNAK